ncbi:hypothetical protein KCU78_g67, partial [Aureobasidium melanogenum]
MGRLSFGRLYNQIAALVAHRIRTTRRLQIGFIVQNAHQLIITRNHSIRACNNFQNHSKSLDDTLEIRRRSAYLNFNLI